MYKRAFRSNEELIQIGSIAAERLVDETSDRTLTATSHHDAPKRRTVPNNYFVGCVRSTRKEDIVQRVLPSSRCDWLAAVKETA